MGVTLSRGLGLQLLGPRPSLILPLETQGHAMTSASRGSPWGAHMWGVLDQVHVGPVGRCRSNTCVGLGVGWGRAGAGWARVGTCEGYICPYKQMRPKGLIVC